MTLGLKPTVKARVERKAVKRTGDMKPLPLTDGQLDWLIDTNLGWVVANLKAS